MIGSAPPVDVVCVWGGGLVPVLCFACTDTYDSDEARDLMPLSFSDRCG